MRALSIRQPWAGAVALGWKPVENRTRAIHYRGDLLIHAAGQLATDFSDAVELIESITGQEIPVLGRPNESPAWAMGAIIGVAQLRVAHQGCSASCSPWAQQGQVHHFLSNARLLRRPVPARGRLGLWVPDADVLAQVREVWPR
jgi:hypothetical protein